MKLQTFELRTLMSLEAAPDFCYLNPPFPYPNFQFNFPIGYNWNSQYVYYFLAQNQLDPVGHNWSWLNSLRLFSSQLDPIGFFFNYSPK